MSALLLDPPIRGEKRNWPLVGYMIVMFSLANAFLGTSLRGLQLMFIENRNYPGGPLVWEQTQYGTSLLAGGNSMSVIAVWFADGFLVRCISA